MRTGRLAGWLTIVLLGTLFVGPVAAPAAGAATATPIRMIYLSAGYVSNVRLKDTKIDGYLSQLDGYGINEGLFELSSFDTTGVATVSPAQITMLSRWAALSDSYGTAHGSTLEIGVVLNGRTDQGLDLDDPTTRSNMVSSVERVAGLGVDAIQLDLEPYPTTPGLVTLLDQIDAGLVANDEQTRISIAAPADTTTWSPSYVNAVTAAVDEVDPLYYDSGKKTTVTQYESWVASSLAYYSANTLPHASLVPVLPSYGSDPWHKPATENITTATTAVETALSAGDAVAGAGIWWWQKFGISKAAPYAADRAEWQAVTRGLAYTG